MDTETRAELLRRLSLIMPRLFDDDPRPAIGRLRALAEKHGLHPTQVGASIQGIDQLGELQRERDEAVMASWRDVGVFAAACQAKGYAGVVQMAKAVNVAPSLVKEWKEIGKVPAVFFSILANAPTRRDREKEIRALMIEAKRRVRAEAKRRQSRLARGVAGGAGVAAPEARAG